MVHGLIRSIDQFSKTIGHGFAWCIIIVTFGTCYEVFMRYALNNPTSWAFDMSYLMYGAVFYMAGAYTLSRGGHVRADMFYRKWRPRTQAVVELTLYVVFFFPGILALVVAGGQDQLKGKILRIGHMGAYQLADIEAVVEALEECVNALGRPASGGVDAARAAWNRA